MSATYVHITAGPHRGMKGERVPTDDAAPDGHELIRIRSSDGYTIVSVDSRHVLGVPAPPRDRDLERLEALDLWLTPYDGGAEHFFPGPPGTLARREGTTRDKDDDMPPINFETLARPSRPMQDLASHETRVIGEYYDDIGNPDRALHEFIQLTETRAQALGAALDENRFPLSDEERERQERQREGMEMFLKGFDIYKAALEERIRRF